MERFCAAGENFQRYKWGQFCAAGENFLRGFSWTSTDPPLIFRILGQEGGGQLKGNTLMDAIVDIDPAGRPQQANLELPSTKQIVTPRRRVECSMEAWRGLCHTIDRLGGPQ